MILLIRMKDMSFRHTQDARVAELADALDLGSSFRKEVWVQVPPLAPVFAYLGFLLSWLYELERQTARQALPGTTSSEISFDRFM